MPFSGSMTSPVFTFCRDGIMYLVTRQRTYTDGKLTALGVYQKSEIGCCGCETEDPYLELNECVFVDDGSTYTVKISMPDVSEVGDREFICDNFVGTTGFPTGGNGFYSDWQNLNGTMAVGDYTFLQIQARINCAGSQFQHDPCFAQAKFCAVAVFLFLSWSHPHLGGGSIPIVIDGSRCVGDLSSVASAVKIISKIPFYASETGATGQHEAPFNVLPSSGAELSIEVFQNDTSSGSGGITGPVVEQVSFRCNEGSFSQVLQKLNFVDGELVSSEAPYQGPFAGCCDCPGWQTPCCFEFYPQIMYFKVYFDDLDSPDHLEVALRHGIYGGVHKWVASVDFGCGFLQEIQFYCDENPTSPPGASSCGWLRLIVESAGGGCADCYGTLGQHYSYAEPECFCDPVIFNVERQWAPGEFESTCPGLRKPSHYSVSSNRECYRRNYQPYTCEG